VEGSYMRRVVTALALVVAAGALVACSSSPTSTTTGASSGTAVPVVSVPAAASGSQAGTNTDILSPTAVVTPGEMFPSDPASVPQAVLDNLTAKKPMLVYFYDPSTSVAADQRQEINAAVKKYSGSIKLVTFDYTVALGSTTTSSTLPAEVNKAVLMTGQLKVNTTPYIVFVDRYGRITYRFAGFTDRGLLVREVLRATE
jgi:hypothetical protein